MSTYSDQVASLSPSFFLCIMEEIIPPSQAYGRAKFMSLAEGPSPRGGSTSSLPPAREHFSAAGGWAQCIPGTAEGKALLQAHLRAVGTFVSIHVGSAFFAERSALCQAKREMTPSRAGAQRRMD